MPLSRTTRQRQAIVDALEGAGGFRSAQDLYEELRSRRVRVGLTTVYRTLQALVAAHAIDAVMTSEGETIYRRCGRSDHHHHLVCEGCGLSFEVGDAAIERWAAATAKSHGFSDVTHSVEVFGKCSTCAGRG